MEELLTHIPRKISLYEIPTFDTLKRYDIVMSPRELQAFVLDQKGYSGIEIAQNVATAEDIDVNKKLIHNLRTATHRARRRLSKGVDNEVIAYLNSGFLLYGDLEDIQNTHRFAFPKNNLQTNKQILALYVNGLRPKEIAHIIKIKDEFYQEFSVRSQVVRFKKSNEKSAKTLNESIGFSKLGYSNSAVLHYLLLNS
jgi:hypothetical protein